MRFIARCLFALLWAASLSAVQAQVTQQPQTFTPLPTAINPLDPR